MTRVSGEGKGKEERGDGWGWRIGRQGEVTGVSGSDR